MNRRDSIKNILTATGILATLPAWAHNWATPDVAGDYGFTFSEGEILASVADTIIPQGDAIGALSVGVDKFLQKLIDNCYEKEIKENVMKQLAALNVAARQSNQSDFKSCNQLQRQELLLKFATSAVKEEKDFFDLMKSETIRGFNTSKEVMLTYLKYKMVPGHYYGCVDATT